MAWTDMAAPPLGGHVKLLVPAVNMARAGGPANISVANPHNRQSPLQGNMVFIG